MDVKCALLNDPLEEEIYVTQSIRFVKQGQESKVYMLHKPPYRLKQALRAENKKIYGFLREKEFVK